MKTGFEWELVGYIQEMQPYWYGDHRKWLTYWGRDLWQEFWDRLLVQSLTDALIGRLLPGGIIDFLPLGDTPFGVIFGTGVNWSVTSPIFSGFVLTDDYVMLEGTSPCIAGSGDYLSYTNGTRYKSSLFRYKIYSQVVISLSYCVDKIYRSIVPWISFGKFANHWGMSNEVLSLGLTSNIEQLITFSFKDIINMKGEVIHRLDELEIDWRLNVALSLNLKNIQFMPESLELASQYFGGTVISPSKRAGYEAEAHYDGYLVGCNKAIFDFPGTYYSKEQQYKNMINYNELDPEIDLSLLLMDMGFRKYQLNGDFTSDVYGRIPILAEPNFSTELTALKPYVTYGIPFSDPKSRVPISGINFIMLAVEPII